MCVADLSFLVGSFASVHACQNFRRALPVHFSGFTDLDKRRQLEIILGLTVQESVTSQRSLVPMAFAHPDILISFEQSLHDVVPDDFVHPRSPCSLSALGSMSPFERPIRLVVLLRLSRFGVVSTADLGLALRTG